MLTPMLLTGLALAYAPIPQNPVLPDGFYECLAKGTGKSFELVDGRTESLGKRIAELSGTATMHSLTNDNTRFGLTLKNAPSFWEGPEPLEYVLIIDGLGLKPAGYTIPNADGKRDYYYRLEGTALAQKIAKKLKCEIIERKDPGHRLEVKWTPLKESYSPGEEIQLKFELKNTGKDAVTFSSGGSQRGARDNQFRFIAQRSGGHGKGVPDTGDPTNEGGRSSRHELKPGDTFTKTVDLNRWFTLTEPDHYRITGIWELHLEDPSRGGFETGIWDDLVAGQCVVVVVKPKP